MNVKYFSEAELICGDFSTNRILQERRVMTYNTRMCIKENTTCTFSFTVILLQVYNIW